MKLDNKKPNYIYFLTDPNDGMVRYIGITNSPKTRFNNHLHQAVTMVSNPKNLWIEELLEKDEYPTMLLVAKFEDRSEAELVEKQLINDFSKKQEIYNTTYIYTSKKGSIVKLSSL